VCKCQTGFHHFAQSAIFQLPTAFLRLSTGTTPRQWLDALIRIAFPFWENMWQQKKKLELDFT